MVCGLAALVAGAAGIAVHRPEPLGLALGLLVGAGNGLLVHRALASGIPFAATSMSRLLLLSLLALAGGFLLFPTAVWAVILGVAAAQLTLAGTALVEVLAR